MWLFKKYFAFIIVLLAPYSLALADDPHSKSLLATGKAKVVSPISIANTDGQGLDFGVIAMGISESVVLIVPQSTVPINVFSGDAVVLTSNPQTAAKFTVSGELGQSYSITLPSSAILTSGSNSLIVDNFSCSNGIGGNIGTDDLFYVGGKLTIPIGAVAGVYQGLFTVTVSYN